MKRGYRWAAPAYKTRATLAWAQISDDVPPEIWGIAFHRDGLDRKDLRHIRVKIIPVKRQKKT